MLDVYGLAWLFAILFIIFFFMFCAFANLYLRELRRADKYKTRYIKVQRRIIELLEAYETARKGKQILDTATRFYKEGEENE